MGQPLGEFVGNALEVYECLKILRNEISPAAQPTWDLSLELSAQMLVLTDLQPDLVSAKAFCIEMLESGQALERFRLNIECQGGDPSVCDDPDALMEPAIKKFEILAEWQGFVTEIDTFALGNAVCEIGGGRTKADDLIDSAVGFSSKLKIGDKVDAGDVIGIVYCRSGDQQQLISQKVRAAYVISAEGVTPPKLIRKIFPSQATASQI